MMAYLPTLAVINGVTSGLPPGYSGVRVASKVQRERAPRAIRVTRIGGRDQVPQVMDRVRCLFECWDTDESDGELLANVAHDIIPQLRGQWLDTIDHNKQPIRVFVIYAECDTRPVRFDDESGQPRFQFQGYLDVSLKQHS